MNHLGINQQGLTCSGQSPFTFMDEKLPICTPNLRPSGHSTFPHDSTMPHVPYEQYTAQQGHFHSTFPPGTALPNMQYEHKSNQLIAQQGHAHSTFSSGTSMSDSQYEHKSNQHIVQHGHAHSTFAPGTSMAHMQYEHRSNQHIVQQGHAHSAFLPETSMSGTQYEHSVQQGNAHSTFFPGTAMPDMQYGHTSNHHIAQQGHAHSTFPSGTAINYMQNQPHSNQQIIKEENIQNVECQEFPRVPQTYGNCQESVNITHSSPSKSLKRGISNHQDKETPAESKRVLHEDTFSVERYQLLSNRCGQHLWDQFLTLELDLAQKLLRLHYGDKVSHIYNPLDYAIEPHKNFLLKYCNSEKQILFLGMNPGPFGMAQTGVRNNYSLAERKMGIENPRLCNENAFSCKPFQWHILSIAST